MNFRIQEQVTGAGTELAGALLFITVAATNPGPTASAGPPAEAETKIDRQASAGSGEHGFPPDVRVVHEEGVKRLIDSDPVVPGVLATAVAKLRQYFGPAPISLEEYVDHEHGGERLLLLVWTRDSVETALEALDRFDAEYWLDARLELGIDLTIDVRSLYHELA